MSTFTSRHSTTVPGKVTEESSHSWASSVPHVLTDWQHSMDDSNSDAMKYKIFAEMNERISTYTTDDTVTDIIINDASWYYKNKNKAESSDKSSVISSLKSSISNDISTEVDKRSSNCKESEMTSTCTVGGENIKEFLIDRTMEAVAVRLHYSSMSEHQLRCQENAIMSSYKKTNFYLARAYFAWESGEYFRFAKKRCQAEYYEVLGRFVFSV